MPLLPDGTHARRYFCAHSWWFIIGLSKTFGRSSENHEIIVLDSDFSNNFRYFGTISMHSSKNESLRDVFMYLLPSPPPNKRFSFVSVIFFPRHFPTDRALRFPRVGLTVRTTLIPRVGFVSRVTTTPRTVTDLPGIDIIQLRIINRINLTSDDRVRGNREIRS